jgi:hypothetical protein
MPTMIRELSPLFPGAASRSYRSGRAAIISNRDFVMVVGFSVIGLLLGLACAFFVPLPDELLSLL